MKSLFLCIYAKKKNTVFMKVTEIGLNAQKGLTVIVFGYKIRNIIKLFNKVINKVNKKGGNNNGR